MVICKLYEKQNNSSKGVFIMSRSLQPLKVSPLIKAARWSLLLCGTVYGFNKLHKYRVLESKVKELREQKIKEKYARLKKEDERRDNEQVEDLIRQIEGH